MNFLGIVLALVLVFTMIDPEATGALAAKIKHGYIEQMVKGFD